MDIEDTKLSLALKLGATAAVKASDQGVIEKVRAITDGNMFDYLVEAAGKTQTIEQGFSLIHPHRGELIFASHPEHGKKISLDPFELISGKSIKGSWGGGAKPVKDMLLIDEMVATGVLDLAPLLDKTYDLYSVNEALNDLENRKIVRALIDLRPKS